MQNSQTIYRDIVLIGGGHAHALVIKMWGMNPVPGVRLTLISQDTDTPYSGMLPGLVSGHYTFEQTHIDLYALCSWANVRFVCAKVSGLSTTRKSVTLQNRPPIEYDLLSINTGSTPNIERTLGAAQFATGVKPISQFYEKWLKLKDKISRAKTPLNIALVGAGAGGFELLLAMQHSCEKINGGHRPKFHWIVSKDKVLTSHNKNVQQHAIALASKLGISIHCHFKVAQVTAGQLLSDDTPAKTLSVDEVIWCTAASPATWPANAGLATDDAGFIAIDNQLRSTSNKDIFAAGDVATQIAAPRPKAGVFAVRQGPVLYKNLIRAVLQQPLISHQPQQHFLSLLATGDKQAIASRGRLYFTGALMWHYKDFIDRKFMDQLQILPVKKEMTLKPVNPILLDEHTDPTSMRCGGCGAKVSSDILSTTLKQVTQDISPIDKSSVIVGLESPDDAAVIDPQQQLLVQSIDHFRSIIDDPYLFAKITVNHALSDLYAMGAKPHSALCIAALPFASDAIQKRELYQLMYGAVEQLNAAHCSLVGGHTSEASELSLGLNANAFSAPNTIKTKYSARPEQVLIITKPLGTGVIMAAHMQHEAKGTAVQQALDTMLQSNAKASEILSDAKCSAMTDITGFALIGHLLEMVRNSNLQTVLNLNELPILTDAIRLSKQGIHSSLYPQNSAQLTLAKYHPDATKHENFAILSDPQTSGGLLAFIDKSKKNQCLSALHQAGFEQAKVIGFSRIKNTAQCASVIIEH